MEATFLTLSGILFGTPRSGDSDTTVLLRVSQTAFVVAGIAILGYIRATTAWLITALGGLHLLAQANAANFLMAYATLSFPVAVRARCIGGISLATYAGCFVGPLIGSIILQTMSRLTGAYFVICTGSIIYACGFIGVSGLRDPSQQAHVDVNEKQAQPKGT